MTASGTILATDGSTDVEAAINAGGIVFTAIAADTAVANNLTTVAYTIGTGADNTAVALTATDTAIETAIAAELADGAADIGANYATGEGFLGLILNDADADGTADSYFLFEYIQDGSAGSAVADVTLIAVLNGTDAANVNPGDFI